MRELLIVIRREFLERVRTRAFLLGTFLFPLFLIGIYTIPFVIGSGGRQRTFALVNEAAPAVGDRIAARLTTVRPQGGRRGSNSYRVERVAGTLQANRTRLTERVQRKEIDGYIHVPADVLQASQVTLRGRNVTNEAMLRDVRTAATEVVQAERLRVAGLDGAQVSALVRPVRIDATRISGKGEEAGSAFANLIVAFVIAFLLYFLLAIYGQAVMRSVIEEKTSRIAEVLVSSISSSRLMLGKVLGVTSVALLQVSIWATIVALIASQYGRISQRLGTPPNLLSALKLEPSVALSALLFFVLGFFVYMALHAALGATVSSEQEVQQLAFFPAIPLILTSMLLPRIVGDPTGGLATAFGLFPLTAPMTMPSRMTVIEIPLWETAASLGLLALTAVAMAWFGGKIYRIGMLSTGKRPSFGEMMRWLRTA